MEIRIRISRKITRNATPDTTPVGYDETCNRKNHSLWVFLISGKDDTRRRHSSCDPAFTWIKDMETGDYAASWKAAFRDNRPVIITDIRSVEKSHPEEYEMYRRLRVENVIGVPYYKYSKGFVVVKNPGCYKNQTALLYFLTYVLMAELNEYKLIQAMSHGAYKCNIRHPNEVRIHLFGGFTLINFEGIHMAHEFPPDELELLMYLAMNPHKAFPAAVLSALVWPGADPGNGGKARRAVSNNRKRGINLSGHHLIVTTSAGYRLNPELKISIDLSVFDQLEQAAAIVNDDAAVQLLENMMDIYTGWIQITNKDLSWLAGYKVSGSAPCKGLK